MDRLFTWLAERSLAREAMPITPAVSRRASVSLVIAVVALLVVLIVPSTGAWWLLLRFGASGVIGAYVAQGVLAAVMRRHAFWRGYRAARMEVIDRGFEAEKQGLTFETWVHHEMHLSMTEEFSP